MRRLFGFALTGLLVTAGCGGGGDGDADDDMMDDTDGAVIILPGSDGSVDGGTSGGDGSVGTDDASTPSECMGIGDPCDPSRGCRFGECFAEFPTAIGGGADAIQESDGDAHAVESIAVTVWQDGYCMPALPTQTAPTVCDPDNPEDTTCGPCGTCVFGGTIATGDITYCLQACGPSLTTNDCRDGYECSLTGEFCSPGCTPTDDPNREECRVYRADTDDNGEIDDGPDNGGMDRLVYDVDSDATCNSTTFRCEHSGGGGEAGDVCERDGQCEANGRCLDEASFETWAGGYCSKFGCNIAGNECAGDNAVCMERRIGAWACLQSCTLDWDDADVDTEDEKNAAWFIDSMEATEDAARGGCPERDDNDGNPVSYACNWNGTSGAVANNGGCLPGEWNAIRGDACEEDAADNAGNDGTGTPDTLADDDYCGTDGCPVAESFCTNIGGSCAVGDMDEDANSRCYAPFGLGFCSALADNGYCLMLDCAAPGVPSNVCGDNGQCVDVDGSAGDTTACLESCETATDCGQVGLAGAGLMENANLGCVEWDGDEATPKVCWPACLETADCRTGAGYECYTDDGTELTEPGMVSGTCAMDPPS